MAPGPVTYEDVKAARLAWADHPVPTDNVTSVLEEMAQQDPTLFQGPGGAEALGKLRETARLIKDRAPDRAQRTPNLILEVFNFLIEKLEPPPAIVAPPPVARLRLGAVQRIMREEAGEPENPPPAGGRRRRTRRRRRGRKSRRKSLRQRK